MPDKKAYIIDRDGIELHRTLFDVPKGYEVDHINLNTMDNPLMQSKNMYASGKPVQPAAAMQQHLRRIRRQLIFA